MILLFLAWNVQPVHAQEWKFEKEKKGIKIFTREEPGKSKRSFKGEVYLHTTSVKIERLLSDTTNYSWWDEGIREVRMISCIKDKTFSYHMVYNVPWPFSDRDLYVRATIEKDTLHNRWTIVSRSIPNEFPEEKGLVRINDFWQIWTVEPVGQDSVHIILEGYADPSGNIPSWLYNMGTTDVPLNILENVKARVE